MNADTEGLCLSCTRRRARQVLPALRADVDRLMRPEQTGFRFPFCPVRERPETTIALLPVRDHAQRALDNVMRLAALRVEECGHPEPACSMNGNRHWPV